MDYLFDGDSRHLRRFYPYGSWLCGLVSVDVGGLAVRIVGCDAGGRWFDSEEVVQLEEVLLVPIVYVIFFFRPRVGTIG